MNTKHTPGPWVLDGDFIIGAIGADAYSGQDGLIVADIDPETEYLKSPMGQKTANARAIVTAVNNTYHKGINPEAVSELLEALQVMVGYIGNIQDKNKYQLEILSIADAAIKKATE